MDDDLKEMIEGFVEDSREAFDSMEEDLMAMEDSTEDPSILNNLFRVMHTLKGTAGFMGLTEISSLSHKLESVFDLVRQNKMEMTPVLLDFLLPAIDKLKELVFALVGEGESPDVTEIVKILVKIVETGSDAVLRSGGAIEAEAEIVEEVTENVSIPAHIKPQLDFDELMSTYGQTPPEPVSEPVAPTPVAVSAVSREESLAKYPLSPLVDPALLSQVSNELLGQFVLEAEEHLETIEESLLALEESPGASEPINSFFRAIHSIKGTAAYVQLKQIELLSHRVENVFDHLRKGKLPYTKDIGDIVFRSIDILRTMVFYVKIEDYAQVIEIAEVATLLDNVMESNAQAAPAEVPTTPKPEKAKDPLAVFLDGAKQQLEVLKAYRQEMNKGILDEHSLITLHRSLKTLGSGAGYCGQKALEQKIGVYEEILLKMLGGEIEQSEIVLKDQVFPIHDQIANDIASLQTGGTVTPAKQPAPPKPVVKTPEKPKETPPPPPAKVEKAPPPPPVEKPKKAAKAEDQDEDSPKKGADKDDKGGAKAAEAKTMRVDASRLDRFMNLIGELIIARNTFKHLADSLDSNQNIADVIRDIKQIENNISRISDNLQDNLMEMRLVQVKTVFQRMPRIVRDIARKTDKKISLQMVGEYTEVDKSIVEEIGDPLVHIIRNSCDHGIEPPDTRKACGKDEQGNIILKAGHMGSFIAIDIIDDGRGIDPKIIKPIAVKKGVISQAESDAMTDEQAVNLIFAPGFSTAAAITDISGRGVGMDVVMTNIRNIQGTVDVKSRVGEGTTVRLKLPLTLAVIEALIVGANGSQYAIPLESIKETVQINEKSIKHLNEKLALELRGEILGVTPLTKLLNLPPAAQNEEEWDDEVTEKNIAIVVLQSNNIEIGIAVDQLYNQQEIVVKPLEDYLASIPGLKGSTIMGDGQIVLILEPNELMEMAVSS
ncbi:MAG: chemotaxis protein CheA [SAR324 cluster bacterium]|nr:chemotaxis protein CheA [SAR324 cluster bacterium]